MKSISWIEQKYLLNEKNQNWWSHKDTYDHQRVFYELWDHISKKLSWDDNSDGNLLVFIISDFLQTTIFTKYFSTLNFALLQ